MAHHTEAFWALFGLIHRVYSSGCYLRLQNKHLPAAMQETPNMTSLTWYRNLEKFLQTCTKSNHCQVIQTKRQLLGSLPTKGSGAQCKNQKTPTSLTTVSACYWSPQLPDTFTCHTGHKQIYTHIHIHIYTYTHTWHVGHEGTSCIARYVNMVCWAKQYLYLSHTAPSIRILGIHLCSGSPCF